jgi:hypothetical protein
MRLAFSSVAGMSGNRTVPVGWLFVAVLGVTILFNGIALTLASNG